jgi:hypothetical protein
MQSRDGGWAAFDADNNWEFLNNVPFADHNAMLDPTCPDITGRVLEALGVGGLDSGHAAIRRGVEFLLKTQEADGSWYGRWGVDYIYGTFLALRGLRAAGYDDREPAVLRGRRVDPLRPERRWRLGRELRQLRPQVLRGLAQYRRRRPPGPFSGCWPAVIPPAKASPTESVIWSNPSAKMAAGTKLWLPAPASRASST